VKNCWPTGKKLSAATEPLSDSPQTPISLALIVRKQTGPSRCRWRRRRETLRRTSRDMGAGSDEVRFASTIKTRPPARRAMHVVRALRFQIGNIAAIVAGRSIAAIQRVHGTNILGSAHRHHILRGTRCGHGMMVGPAVAGRENDHHLLIAGGRVRRTGRLSVPNQGIEQLRVGVISAPIVFPPTVVADTRSVMVGVGQKIAKVRIGGKRRIEHHGRATLTNGQTPRP